MSSEIMAWMRIRPKINDEKAMEGFKAFVELVKYNTINIEDPRTSSSLAYLSERDNKEIFRKTNQLDGNSCLTLMGYGDSWFFESGQALLDLIIEHREALVKNMAYKKDDRKKLEVLLDTIEKSKLKLDFSNVIYREEDIDILGGFDEFVWCSYKGCKVPAEYNFKLLEDGSRKGYDKFPAGNPLVEEDLPYCEKHYNEMVRKHF